MTTDVVDYLQRTSGVYIYQTIFFLSCNFIPEFIDDIGGSSAFGIPVSLLSIKIPGSFLPIQDESPRYAGFLYKYRKK